MLKLLLLTLMLAVLTNAGGSLEEANEEFHDDEIYPKKPKIIKILTFEDYTVVFSWN